MKLEIYEDSKEEEEKELVLRLRLIPSYLGISVIAVDESGMEVDDGPFILTITKDGRFKREGSCCVKGLQLHKGKIIEDKSL